MNRLVCPECGQASYCASLTGPLHCANADCGAVLIPGGEVDAPADRRLLPRLGSETEITIEFLDQDRRVVERQRSYIDVSVLGISTVLENYPAVGADVVVELSDAAVGGKPWRVRGVVREVKPAEGNGYRVGIEVRPGARVD